MTVYRCAHAWIGQDGGVAALAAAVAVVTELSR